mmetsp:Transcript_20811/g.24594  ORF Transcript_20811/g.24594 Transcript_20811/m.24594 type:complete len:106 (-) Transcript_20811:209-526(-)
MDRFLKRLEAYPQARSADHYNVPRKAAKKTKQIEAAETVSKPETVTNEEIEVPVNFWEALNVFLGTTSLTEKEKTMLVAQFKQAHEQQIASLSLDDFEDLLEGLS